MIVNWDYGPEVEWVCPDQGHSEKEGLGMVNMLVGIKEKVAEKKVEPWLVWLSGLSASLRTERSPVRFPFRAHAWVVGQVPSQVCVR